MSDAAPAPQDSHEAWSRFFSRTLTTRTHWSFVIVIGIFVLLGNLSSMRPPQLHLLQSREITEDMSEAARAKAVAWNDRVNVRNPEIQDHYDREMAWWRNDGEAAGKSRILFYKAFARIMTVVWMSLLAFGYVVGPMINYLGNAFGQKIGAITSPIVILAVVHALATLMQKTLAVNPPTHSGPVKAVFELFANIIGTFCEAITNFSQYIITVYTLSGGLIAIIVYSLAMDLLREKKS